MERKRLSGARDRDVPRGTNGLGSPPDCAERACPERSTGNTLTGADPAVLELLLAGAHEIGTPLEPDQAQCLALLAELLATWAPRMNLTGYRSSDEIVRRLVLDAIAMEPHLPVAGAIADLGSGAGFPGLPLAVLRPSVRLVLVEARERRHHFQKAAIRALGLRQVVAVRGRIEGLEPRPCGGVVAQALARPGEALRLARSWCAPGGWIAIPGGASPPEPGPLDGISARPAVCYQVPLGGPERTLWLGSRTGTH